MSEPKDHLIDQLVALRGLRDTEQRLGVEPLRRRDDCPRQSELLATVHGKALPAVADRVHAHAEECAYCAMALRTLEAFLNNEELPDQPEDAEDSTARWIESDEASTRTGAGTSVGFTNLARDPRLWPRLIEELHRWLPHLLRKTQLDAAWADDVLNFVKEQLPTLGQRRFTPMLDQWLREFAQGRQATPAWEVAAATEQDLEPGAIGLVLSTVPGNEPESIGQLRKTVLAKGPLTRAELLNLPYPEEGNVGWVRQQLREWYFQSGVELQHGQELFEIA